MGLKKITRTNKSTAKQMMKNVKSQNLFGETKSKALAIRVIFFFFIRAIFNPVTLFLGPYPEEKLWI